MLFLFFTSLTYPRIQREERNKRSRKNETTKTKEDETPSSEKDESRMLKTIMGLEIDLVNIEISIHKSYKVLSN